MAAKTIQITAEERRVLYLAGSFHAEGDWLDHTFREMHPCPVNGYTSTVPDRDVVQQRVAELVESVALFDAIGWHLDDPPSTLRLPSSLAPLLHRYIEFGIEEMEDLSAVLLRKLKAGDVHPGDWVPPDHDDRGTEDELLERAYVFARLLERMEGGE